MFAGRDGDQGALGAEMDAWLNGVGILAFDSHLKDFVGAFVGVDLGMGQECDEAFLKGAEAAFDFAFGLRRRSNEVCYTNASQFP